MDFTIKFRRDEAADWSRRNPTLAEGEPGVEMDTGKFKVGDGVTRWGDLPYFVPGDHAAPSPGDEDGPSLALLYENAKV